MSAIFMAVAMVVIVGVAVRKYIVKYVEAFRRNISNVKDSAAESPSAKKNYFLGRAYSDLIYIFFKPSNKKNKFAKKRNGWVIFGMILVWPIGAAVFLVCGAIHIVIILMCTLTTLLLWLVTWARDAGYRWRNGIFTVCPYPNCNNKSKLPAYRCPYCKEEIYDNLYPSPYGIWKRKCSCGKEIPTAFFNGRNNLDSYCPECKKPIKLKKSRPIEIPIAGAQLAGKTSFMRSMISYIETKFKSNYEPVDETPEKIKPYDSVPLRFYITRGNDSSLIHIYDSNGKAFYGSKSLVRHKFYNHLDGLVFIIDPFSIPNVRLKYESRLAGADIKSGLTPADDVFESLIMNFEKNCNVKVTGRITKPIAVVFSKTGVFDLPEIFFKHGASADERNEACRQFLRDNGEDSFLRKLEWRFANVRYFAVDSKEEDSVGIDDVVDWLLGNMIRRNAVVRFAKTVGVFAGALAAVCAIAAGAFFAVRAASPGVRSAITWTHRVSTETRWYTANPGATNYTISTADELAGLARIVNGEWRWLSGPERDSFSRKTITLAGDIDLSSYENWVPIGNYAADVKNVFSGTFDGGGHVIHGLKIDRSDADRQGLFGRVDFGRIQNLGLDSVDIRGRGRVGGVAGTVDMGSRVVNCHVSGIISGRVIVGGVAGEVAGSSDVVGGYFIGTVGGNGNVGGVAGQVILKSNVSKCYSVGTVRGDNMIGGVVGVVRDSSGLADCYSVATVIGGGAAGGVAGAVTVNSYVSGSYSAGAVSGNNEVGGVAGSIRNNGRVIGSAAFNPIVKGTGTDVGRVVGASLKNSKLLNNVAISGMKNISDNTAWSKKGLTNLSGADISAVVIKRDGTVEGRFIAANGWTTQNGTLPGMVESVVMPPHLVDDGHPE